MSQPPQKPAPLQDKVSRRDFFNRCSATATRAATGAIAAPLALAAELGQQVGQEPPVRLGILGLGHRGLHLAETALRTPGLQLVAAFDPHLPTADRAKTRLARLAESPVKIAVNEAELLESKELDAIVIATPADLHARQALAALAAGRHLLTEKPVGLNKAELDTLLPVVQTLDKQVFMVAQERRHQPHRAALAEWLKARPLGELVDFQASWTHPQGPPRGRDNWMLHPARSGDWLAEHGDHLWEMLLEFMGEVPEVTTAQRLTREGESSRFFSVHLRWPSGVTAHVRHSMLPGGNFQSPGLVFLAQFEQGLVDLIHGRLSAPDQVKRLAPSFPTETDDTQAMLAGFAYRVRKAHMKETLQAANLHECRLAAQVHEFRSRIAAQFA